MRALDVLTKADSDIRVSTQPRYHLEMALLRWIHLRKLVPLSDLIQGLEKGAPAVAPRGSGGVPPPSRPAASTASPRPAAPTALPRPTGGSAATVTAVESRRDPPARAVSAPRPPPAADGQPVGAGQLKDAFLEEVRRAKKFFHGTVIAMAQKIELDGDRIVFTFGPHHRALRVQLDQTRAWLEDLASRLAGRRVAVVSAEGVTAVPKPGGPDTPVTERQAELKQQALEDSGVQAMLDVFAAEIKDVEER